MIAVLPRNQINDEAWDSCVAASSQRVVYGYGWYLDAVLPRPNWKWVGLVLADKADGYRAVMPVPLRRKVGVWRVHQPFFCQFLSVFCRDESVDPTPFFRLMQQQFRYGSLIHLTTYPDPTLSFDVVRQHVTHVLDLSAGYETIAQRYTRDRKLNLRRAETARWTTVDMTDPEPLLTLFRDNHASDIPGGVAPWAYEMLRRLYDTLQKRGLTILRYALLDGRIEAGALFVQEGNRIIYLFNAASETGRRGNARTLLIDQFIRERAGQNLIFDFESPEKSSVAAFYRSFGTSDVPFWSLRWNRLTPPEKAVGAMLRRLG